MMTQELVVLHIIAYEDVLPKVSHMEFDLLKIDMGHSVSDFWNGGAHFLAIAQVICTVVGPFIISMSSLVVLVAPLSYDNCELVVTSNLWVSKWTLLNLVNFAIIVAAFSVHIDKLSLNITLRIIVPNGGLFNAFMPTLTIIFNYLMFMAHRYIRENDEKYKYSLDGYVGALLNAVPWENGISEGIFRDSVIQDGDLETQQNTLMNEAVTFNPTENRRKLQHRESGSSSGLRTDKFTGVDIFSIFFLGLSVGCYCITLSDKVFKVDLEGLITTAYDDNQKHQAFSFADLLSGVWNYFPGNMTILGMAFVGPITAYFTRIIFIYKANDLSYHIHLFFSCFQCLEVFALAFILNSLELGTFSQFLVDQQVPELCDKVNKDLHEPCLRANSAILESQVWLAATAMFYILSCAVYPLSRCCSKKELSSY